MPFSNTILQSYSGRPCNEDKRQNFSNRACPKLNWIDPKFYVRLLCFFRFKQSLSQLVSLRVFDRCSSLTSIWNWFQLPTKHHIEISHLFFYILKRRSLVSIDICSLDLSSSSSSSVRYSLIFGWTFATWLTFRFQWQFQGGKVTLISLRLKMVERMGFASCASETTRTKLVFLVISWSISNECTVENTPRYSGRKLKGTSHRRFLQRSKIQMYFRYRIKPNKIKWMSRSRRTCWSIAISLSVSSRIVRSVNSWRSVVENGNQFHQNLSKLI